MFSRSGATVCWMLFDPLSLPVAKRLLPDPLVAGTADLAGGSPQALVPSARCDLYMISPMLHSLGDAAETGAVAACGDGKTKRLDLLYHVRTTATVIRHSSYC